MDLIQDMTSVAMEQRNKVPQIVARRIADFRLQGVIQIIAGLDSKLERQITGWLGIIPRHPFQVAQGN